ncbi:MAG TPA: lipid-binding SYLF domain-containing protein [Candidatus Atribacteria bacterium]|nr:lipid-binding SYLF domain-containing protein [Candidatus Atribacteria bacterium]HPU08216.1 lipid-binding SYLF domain-containing protein [Candidatus Atribacteria bacterium]HQE25385.1 lipid-binding SYLF domain-containing protein [Candidatus Atribacteria bacterium]
MKQRLIVVTLILLLVVFVSSAEANERGLINKAIELIYDLSQAPDRAPFLELLKRAEGIAIFPEVRRVGMVIGGYSGEGIVLRRDRGYWYGPAFFRLEGISLGPHFGVEVQGLVLLLMNRSGMEIFYQGGATTLSGSLGIAAGPIGRSFSLGVDTELQASIYSYSLSRGLFWGASLEGAKLVENERAAQRFYQKRISSREILTSYPVEETATRNLTRLLENLIKEREK